VSFLKQFITSSVIIIVGSLSAGAILTAPTPLDAVLSYQKPELAPLPYFLEKTELPLNEHEEEQDSILEEAEGIIVDALESIEIEEIVLSEETETRVGDDAQIPTVPFFSQLNDITAPSWKKIGCGIASLAMLIEYYNPGTVSVDTLLQEGIDARAYLESAGWTYAGLIGVAKKYSIAGETHDYGTLQMDDAYGKLLGALDDGPVMASVHYTFQKSNPIPHLVVINGIENDNVFYNDPAEEEGGGSVSVEQFKSAWKKRYIEFRPL